MQIELLKLILHKARMTPNEIHIITGSTPRAQNSKNMAAFVIIVEVLLQVKRFTSVHLRDNDLMRNNRINWKSLTIQNIGIIVFLFSEWKG